MLQTQYLESILFPIQMVEIVERPDGEQRRLAKSIISDNLIAEEGAFTFPNDSGGEVVPFVHVPNLIAKSADLVEVEYVLYKVDHA